MVPVDNFKLQATASSLEAAIMRAREAKDVEDVAGLTDALNEIEELIATLQELVGRPP